MGLYQSGVELTDEEVDLMVQFLLTLTGEYQGAPLTNSNDRSMIHGHDHDHDHGHGHGHGH